jgi:transmembrane sensor
MYPSEKDKAFFFQLLERYQAGTASPEEIVFVERYLDVLNNRQPDVETAGVETEIYQRLQQSMKAEQPKLRPVRGFGRWWAVAAAASVLLLAYAIYSTYQLARKNQQPPIAAVQDVAPGRQGAILTLQDGSQVVLDSLHNGIVARQSGAAVTLANGQLSYSNDARTKNDVYNTMSTPRGRQYALVLPDGTKVWLNAASSLTFPVAFNGAERKVKVSGEAYFEVAQQASKPFKVEVSDGTEIQVLGTHFNINAYPDESSMNTTLLEGRVKVVTSAASQQLAPGEQAQVPAHATYVKLVHDADVQQVTAWKDGSFAFSHADLPTVMRQLSRWYDIQVTYEGDIPKATFSGEIDRSLTLVQVLKGLAATEIHYRIENGNRLIIQP